MAQAARRSDIEDMPVKRDGRSNFMDVTARVGMLESELTEHEESVVEQLAALRFEMKEQNDAAKASQTSTNRLLFGILMAILTVMGGLIVALAQRI